LGYIITITWLYRQIFIFGAIGILGSEYTHSFSLFPEEDEDKASKEGFLKTEEVETLLEECLVM